MLERDIELIFIRAVAADFDVCEAELSINKMVEGRDFDYQNRFNQARTRIDNVENDGERLFWIDIALTTLKKRKND